MKRTAAVHKVWRMANMQWYRDDGTYKGLQLLFRKV